MLELKRSKPVRVRARMVEFIPLQFFSSKLRIWPFHVVRSSAGTKKKGPGSAVGGKRPIENKNRKNTSRLTSLDDILLLFFFLPTPIFFFFFPNAEPGPRLQKSVMLVQSCCFTR